MDFEKEVHAGGHAVLLLNNDFAVCFYKTLNPTIVFKSGKKIELKVLENLEYKNKRLSKYRDLAKELIEHKIVVADSDSLNYGRSEAHDKYIQVLKELLGE